MKGCPQEITITAVYCPSRHNLKKKEHFEKFFQTLGSTFVAGGDCNSEQPLWGSRLKTTKGRELSKVLQENNSYSFLSTGRPTYWPTVGNKTPDLLDFFVTNRISLAYTDIQSSYDLTSGHSPIVATINTSAIVSKPAQRLHNSQTNWDTYSRIIQDKANLSIILKEYEDVELDVELKIYSVYSSMLPKKLPQKAIPKEKLIKYSTKLRDW